jgi:hypothetical protein
MFTCESCQSKVEPDAKGRYQCLRCGKAGYYVVTPIPQPLRRPENEDAKPVFWVSFSKGDAPINEVLLQLRQLVQEFRKRPVAELRNELEKTGFLSIGPFFPNDAEALVTAASRRGIQAEMHPEENPS